MKKNIDMTSGKPIKHLVRFGTPILLGAFFQQLYNLTDGMLAGHILGYEAAGAVGSTSALYVLFVGIIMGLNGGYSIIVAKHFGKKDVKNIKLVTSYMLMFNIITAILFTFIAFFAIYPLLNLLKTPPDILENAYSYIVIVLAGVCFSVFYNMYAGIVTAIGDSKAPLLFLAISSILNIILTYAFLSYTNLELKGAAYATVISQLVSALLCFSYTVKKYRKYIGFFISPNKYFTKLSYKTLTTGLSVGLLNSVVTLGSVAVQSVINGYGTAAVTGYTAARRVFILMCQPFVALATSSATFISQNFGAKKHERIMSAAKVIAVFCIVWSAISFCVMFFFGRVLTEFILGQNEEEVLIKSEITLRITAPFMIFYGLVTVLRSCIQSVGERITPVISGVLELVLKTVAVFALGEYFDYTAVNFVEPLVWVICVLQIIFSANKIRKTKLSNNKK